MLRATGTEVLVDIRRHAGSRRVEWARSPELARTLPESGIEYVAMPELGGRRRPVPGSVNTAWRNAQFQGYADHMATREFRDAARRLIRLAQKRQVAVMCAEAVPWRCHRSLLADFLVAQGIDVLQAIDERHVAPHRVTPFARIEAGQVTYPAEKTLDHFAPEAEEAKPRGPAGADAPKRSAAKATRERKPG